MITTDTRLHQNDALSCHLLNERKTFIILKAQWSHKLAVGWDFWIWTLQIPNYSKLKYIKIFKQRSTSEKSAKIKILPNFDIVHLKNINDTGKSVRTLSLTWMKFQTHLTKSNLLISIWHQIQLPGMQSLTQPSTQPNYSLKAAVYMQYCLPA